MRSVSQAIEMLDITDNKKIEVFNGLDNIGTTVYPRKNGLMKSHRFMR